MPSATLIASVNNSVTSSFTTIASTPRRALETIRTTTQRSPIMDAPVDASTREDSATNPDRSETEIASQEQLGETAHQGGTGGHLTAGPPNRYPHVIHPDETQQPHTYYDPYNNSQISPEPPSPTNVNGRVTYNAGGSFFQPQSGAGFQNSAFTNDVTHPYAGTPTPQPPSSPTQTMGGIPPASPLFPRMTMTGTVPYLNNTRAGDVGVTQGISAVPSGYPSSSGMYMSGSYPVLGGRPNGGSSTNSSSTHSNNAPTDEFVPWNENRTAPYSLSSGQGGMPYVSAMPPRPDRSSSFDDTPLPHSSSDGSINAYGAVPGAGPQAWGYGPPPPDVYGNNSNVSQTRPSIPYPNPVGGQYRHPPHYGGPYGGPFGYPTTSPGPPIQTTSSNKGPDGANLFIFHIPNHFTNLDMYHLFSPYGNLLSVRIMVEKESGRSRGFGFVSYDNPDAAALAIKELNGFNIGNKRLKVQHKQIRPAEQQQSPHMYHGMQHADHPPQHGGGRGRGRGGYRGNNLPPSGPVTMASAWYTERNDRNNGPSPSSMPGDVGSGEGQNVVVVLGDGTSNGANVATAESVASSTVVSGQGEHQATADALSTMDHLAQSLPDIGGVSSAPPSSGD
mmetsp:Transcript_7787/g.22860  ORF Transcript_7787/g.22860 Transcript_7787/m.22860 type:complete len:616 (+) Transcript_7787:468-2315(+)